MCARVHACVRARVCTRARAHAHTHSEVMKSQCEQLQRREEEASAGILSRSITTIDQWSVKPTGAGGREGGGGGGGENPHPQHIPPCARVRMRVVSSAFSPPARLSPRTQGGGRERKRIKNGFST